MRNNVRIWALLAGAAVLVLVAGGWFLGVQPMLATAAAADESTATLVAQNQGLEVKLSALAKTAAKSEELTAKEAVLEKSVPDILKPNTFIRRVNEVAAQDGVTVQSVTPGDAAAYSAPASVQAAAAAAALAAAPVAAGATPAPTPTPAAAPVAAVAQAPVLAKTDPLITAANLAVVPMNVSVEGTADATLQFVKDIQNDERLYLVSGYSTSVASEGVGSSGLVTAQLTGSIYTLAR